MTKNAEMHHRRSLRLRDYDYAGVGAYFVTVCTYSREHILGEIEDGAMTLSPCGRIVEDCWNALSRHFKRVVLDVFVVMPNHIHGIVIIAGSLGGGGEAFADYDCGFSAEPGANASPLQVPRGTDPGSLGAIVQNFKSVSARKINRLRHARGAPVWQRNYYEHVIRSDDDLNEIREYILNNPLQWDLDEENQ